MQTSIFPQPPDITRNNGPLTQQVDAVEEWAMRNDSIWNYLQRQGERSKDEQLEIYRTIAAVQMIRFYRANEQLITQIEQSTTPPTIYSPKPSPKHG